MKVEIDLCCWAIGITAIVLLFLIIRFIRSKIKVNPKGKAVLITGCDTGFGLMTTERLAKKGFKIFAGCLTDEGVERLKEKKDENIIPIKMDVTNEESVRHAYEEVKVQLPGGQGLWGVINNAGLLRSGELEIMSINNWRIQLNVNVMGMVITTKQFYPLLLKGKGRVVNIASVAGRFATATTSGYNASKYAVEGLSDSWRREMSIWGIRVILIEPGIMKTPLWDAPFDEAKLDVVWNSLNGEQQERYGREFFIDVEKNARELMKKFAGDPKQVVDVLEHSVYARYPYSRYGVGFDSIIWISLSYLPTFISDFLVTLIMKPVLPQALRKKK